MGPYYRRDIEFVTDSGTVRAPLLWQSHLGAALAFTARRLVVSGGVQPQTRFFSTYAHKIRTRDQSLQIPVKLLWDKAPETCALVAELASANELEGSRFYRNEPVPAVRCFHVVHAVQV